MPKLVAVKKNGLNMSCVFINIVYISLLILLLILLLLFIFSFRHGFQFVYVGELSENQIEIFALSSFKDSPRQPVKEPMGSL